MTTKFSKGFNRRFAKLSPVQKKRVMDAVELFLANPAHKALRIHQLTEEWADWSSMSADNDLRLHFRMLDENTVFFVALGTHGELYR